MKGREVSIAKPNWMVCNMAVFCTIGTLKRTDRAGGGREGGAEKEDGSCGVLHSHAFTINILFPCIFVNMFPRISMFNRCSVFIFQFPVCQFDCVLFVCVFVSEVFEVYTLANAMQYMTR